MPGCSHPQLTAVMDRVQAPCPVDPYQGHVIFVPTKKKPDVALPAPVFRRRMRHLQLPTETIVRAL
jgi:hypothetical protein